MKLFIAKGSLFFISTISSPGLNAGNLCLPVEKTIFSFETKSKKILSVCKKLDASYLAYRFGPRKKIELLFPSNLDITSWEKFNFYGMSRGGGKANAGFGDYSLSFKNGNAEYTVFQQWSNENDTYNIGVTIVDAYGKAFTLAGLKQTQEGSLTLLDDENEYIANDASLSTIRR